MIAGAEAPERLAHVRQRIHGIETSSPARSERTSAPMASIVPAMSPPTIRTRGLSRPPIMRTKNGLPQTMA